MSHSGEGSVYQDKPPPSKKMPGRPRVRAAQPPTEKVSGGDGQSSSGPVATEAVSRMASPSGTQGAVTAEKAQAGASDLPDPTTLVAQTPPPPPLLPRSGNAGGASSGMQSQLTRQLAEAQDTHQLAAHKIVEEPC